MPRWYISLDQNILGICNRSTFVCTKAMIQKRYAWMPKEAPRFSLTLGTCEIYIKIYIQQIPRVTGEGCYCLPLAHHWEQEQEHSFT